MIGFNTKIKLGKTPLKKADIPSFLDISAINLNALPWLFACFFYIDSLVFIIQIGLENIEEMDPASAVIIVISEFENLSRLR